MKFVIVVDNGVRIWWSRKNFDGRFFREIWVIRTLIQQRKSTVIHLKTPRWDLCFALRLAWRNSNLWLLRNACLKMSETKKVTLLAIFGLSTQWCNEHNSTILPTKYSLKLGIFDADPDRADKTCSFDDILV